MRFPFLDVESATINDPRIIGGVDTNIEEIPWQVSVRLLGAHMCGGSIIDANRILTAAHCFMMTNSTKRYSVLVGATNNESEGQVMDVSRIHIHEKYDVPKNDIAIIVLKNPLKFTKKIQPIKLPKSDADLKEGTEVTVSGWGVTEHSSWASEKLKSVVVEIIDRKECKKLMNSFQFGNTNWAVDSNMLCAGIPMYGGKDSCQVIFPLDIQ